MSYAQPADMIARYDVRRLGDLVRDDTTRATPTELTAPDPVLQTALDDAAGEIDASVLAGKKYFPSDLAGLTGTDKALLLRLNCDLAYGFLVMRRGYSAADAASQAPGFARALALLDLLRDGAKVFGVEANREAGLSRTGPLSRNIHLISHLHRFFGEINLNFGNSFTETRF
jgi:phage gp36-like protein